MKDSHDEKDEHIFSNEDFYEGFKTHIKMDMIYESMTNDDYMENWFEIFEQMLAEVRGYTL